MLRNNRLTIKSLIVASSWSHIYLLIKDARSLEHKVLSQRSFQKPPSSSVVVKEREELLPLWASVVSWMVSFTSSWVFQNVNNYTLIIPPRFDTTENYTVLDALTALIFRVVQEGRGTNTKPPMLMSIVPHQR